MFWPKKEDFASFKVKILLETSTIKIVLQICYFSKFSYYFLLFIHIERAH